MGRGVVGIDTGDGRGSLVGGGGGTFGVIGIGVVGLEGVGGVLVGVALLIAVAVDAGVFGLVGVFDLVLLAVGEASQGAGVAGVLVALGVSGTGGIAGGVLGLDEGGGNVWRYGAHGARVPGLGRGRLSGGRERLLGVSAKWGQME